MFRSPCCGCSKTEKSAGSGPPRRWRIDVGDNCHQPGIWSSWWTQQSLPGGFVLPDQCLSDQYPVSAGEDGRREAVGGLLPGQYSDIRPGGRVEGFTAEAWPCGGIPLAGERAPTGEKRGAGGLPGRGELVTAAELPRRVRAFQGSAPSPSCPWRRRVPLWGARGGRGGADQDMLHRTHGNVGGGPLAGHQPKNFISKAPTVSHRLQLASDLIYRMTQMKL